MQGRDGIGQRQVDGESGQALMQGHDEVIPVFRASRPELAVVAA